LHLPLVVVEGVRPTHLTINWMARQAVLVVAVVHAHHTEVTERVEMTEVTLLSKDTLAVMEVRANMMRAAEAARERLAKLRALGLPKAALAAMASRIRGKLASINGMPVVVPVRRMETLETVVKEAGAMGELALVLV